MAYADFAGKIILHSWGRCRLTLLEACVVGDLLSYDGYLADADIAVNRPAAFVACEDGAIADVVWVAKKTEIKKPPTQAVGGGVTAGTHGAAANDILWLSTTAGDAANAAVAGIGQIVGVALSLDRILLEPAETFDPFVELVAADKSLAKKDSGKQMYVNTDAKTITLPTGAAGYHFEIVNAGQFGKVLVKVSPGAGDTVNGGGIDGTKAKDRLNTKASAQPGDRIVVLGSEANTYYVTKLRGIWTEEE